MGLAVKVFDQEWSRPARKGIAQVSWIVLQRRGQGRLVFGIGFARSPRTLARVECVQATFVEGLQSSEHGGTISPDNVADLLNRASLSGQQHRLGAKAHADAGRLLS